MERRQFLYVTAAGAIGTSLSVAAWIPLTEPSWAILARPDLLTMLGRRSVMEVGLAYRSAHEDGDSPEALASVILSDAGPSANDATTESGLCDLMRKQIRSDFADRRTVRLNGWILSVTEARQCALYSMLSS